MSTLVQRPMSAWATIPKQTFLVEEGKVGDCWRCCIAAIMDRPADTVPHFLLEVDRNDGGSCDANTQRWLNACGWALILVCSPHVFFPRWGRDDFAGLPVISCGPTVRSKAMGHHHAIVTINGATVYDPHPSNAGLLAITETYLVVPFTP